MKKGFTLIELLAVIVILAIIALIATPIILNIINDARESANARSVELYGKAIENTIAKSMLNGEEVATGDLSSTFLSTVQYSGSTVSCETKKLYSDGSIYLAGCTVGTDTTEYTYGTEQTEASTQVYKPQYYSWDLSGTVGTTDSPANPSTEPPTGKDFYLWYDVANGKVSAAYICFVRNNIEYCLKGYDTDVYSTNADVIRDAYSEVADTNACSFGDGSSHCDAGGLYAIASSRGGVGAGDGIGAVCNVFSDGYVVCIE